MPKDLHDTIPGFTPVAPTVWEYLPTPATIFDNTSPDLPPDLILLFSWTGANGRHVLKYTKTYQSLFPSTPIMVITTSLKDLCYRSSSTKQRRLQRAVDRVQSLGKLSNILIHVFSEGGSNKAAEFAEAYHSATSRRLPCSALCLDSTPGHPRFLRMCNALKKSLPPSPILRFSGLAVGGVVVAGIWLVYGVFKGYENNVVSKTRRRVLDETYWDPTAPRCYLYSKADELISWEDIQEHVHQSATNSIPVMSVCFDQSAHCKHAAEDYERYWDAVTQTWKRATPTAVRSKADFSWLNLDDDDDFSDSEEQDARDDIMNASYASSASTLCVEY
ncbi:hypothetical protein EJ04DRAFT_515831 [Polyplosphaeria fusca]|uniref:Transmembrane protein 53 n=1 Tax=Polyplosphaeria fusca TaxID=682080 RepID=A0A9P4QR71_9PLEO|nr:hypothetical protein EJ04DRAFT_515831 [Polyplosphaeria fusca]